MIFTGSNGETVDGYGGACKDIADSIYALDQTDGRDMGTMHPEALEAVADCYIAARMAEQWPEFERLHDRLKDRGHDNRHSFSYNDNDNDAYYVRCSKPDTRVMVWESQQTYPGRWLIIQCGDLDNPMRALHARRIWDHTSRIGQYRAERHTLDWHHKRDWHPNGDYHADEYLLTYTSSGIPHALYHMRDIIDVLGELYWLNYALDEQEKKA